MHNSCCSIQLSSESVLTQSDFETFDYYNGDTVKPKRESIHIEINENRQCIIHVSAGFTEDQVQSVIDQMNKTLPYPKYIYILCEQLSPFWLDSFIALFSAIILSLLCKDDRTKSKISLEFFHWKLGIAELEDFLSRRSFISYLKYVSQLVVDDCVLDGPTADVVASSLLSKIGFESISIDSSFDNGNFLQERGSDPNYDIKECPNFIGDQTSLKFADNSLSVTEAANLIRGVCALSSVSAKLQRLALCGNSLSDIGVILLVSSIMSGKTPNLSSLDLSRNNITSVGCIMLSSAIEKLNFLTELILSENEIGDRGVMALAKTLTNVLKTSEKRSQLQRLSLRDCGMTSVGSASLSLFVSDPTCTLRHLDLASNRLGTRAFLCLPNHFKNDDGCTQLQFVSSSVESLDLTDTGFNGRFFYDALKFISIVFSRLKRLRIRANRIGCIDKPVKIKSNLKNTDLTSEISDITDDHDNTTNLQYLIKYIEDPEFLPMLSSLDLRENRFDPTSCLYICNAIRRRSSHRGNNNPMNENLNICFCIKQIDLRGNPVGSQKTVIQDTLIDIPGITDAFVDDGPSAADALSDGFCGCCYVDSTLSCS